MSIIVQSWYMDVQLSDCLVMIYPSVQSGPSPIQATK